MSNSGKTAENPSMPTGQPLYLSKFLSEGRIQDVSSASRVALPGLEIESYSGYVTVDTQHDSNLFFWFFPSAKVPPEQAPLIVYLNGGPGNSSLIGLFEEIGPIRVTQNGQVCKREVTWADSFSVIFVDSPVGVGFSYCGPGGECKTNQAVADNLYCFLTQFLQLYPSYQECDVYIGGQSYAGKYAPAFAHKVHTEMDLAEPPVLINLRGIFVGAGLCDPAKMLPLYPKFLVSLGMITEKKGREITERIEYAKDKHKHLGKHEEAIVDIIENVFTNMQDHLGYKELDNVLRTKEYGWQFATYLNRPDVQRALHVKPTQYSMFTERMLLRMAEDFLGGVSEELTLIMDNYKVLLFNGHMDLIVSVPMTEALLSDLPWSGRAEYLQAEKRKWLGEDGEVAGYVTKVKDFTRVVMRKAGHRASIDQPMWTLDMISRFIHDKSFQT